MPLPRQLILQTGWSIWCGYHRRLTERQLGPPVVIDLPVSFCAVKKDFLLLDSCVSNQLISTGYTATKCCFVLCN